MICSGRPPGPISMLRRRCCLLQVHLILSPLYAGMFVRIAVSTRVLTPPITGTIGCNAFLVPFLLDPAAALGRHPHGHMKLHCSDLAPAFLPGLCCMDCARQSPSASASLCILAWSAVAFALAVLPAFAPVLHLSAPVRSCAVTMTFLVLA